MNDTETLTTGDRLIALGLLVVVLVVFGLAVWLLYRVSLWFVVIWYGDRWGIQQDSVFSKPYRRPETPDRSATSPELSDPVSEQNDAEERW